MTNSTSHSDSAAVIVGTLVLGLAVVFLFVSGAPSGGAFSWPDSPRHALNGAFVMDLIRDMPYADPKGYAYNYYSQYPALTILFYPPLFSFILAPFYAVLGVSQNTALVVLGLLYFAMIWGVYALARLWCRNSIALVAALIFAFLPEISYWGRQVMLEIPAYAILVWSAYAFCMHIRSGRVSLLYLAVALLVLSLYTKLSVAFVAFPFLVTLLSARGLSLFRDWHSYVIAALALVGMVPLVVLTLEFGQANIQSAAGIADSQVSRTSLEAWLWYAQRLPSQMGWAGFLAALGGVGTAVAMRRSLAVSRFEAIFWGSWFVAGYIFYSAVDLKEARHSIFLLLPAGLSIGLLGEWLCQRHRWAGIATVGVVLVASVATTTLQRPVHYVAGYREVVDYVAAKAPANSNILFSGYRDGSFIFNMRAHADRKDVSTIRADKLLLRISVRRELGVEEKDYTEAEIDSLIDSLGVHYVVAQPDFWTDLKPMAKLQSLLHSDRFEEVARFKMQANYHAQEKELVVYRNRGEVAEGPINISNELPIVGRTVSGTISGD
ncbi:glycosyltransferase family 39 protein [Aestuariispira ectoiniformans]|uniref:glycosyltransferase family 39 protein n=1 Tax=Aestuariispira ectoiniformans TaxID=2775080 RepID=UPI00223AD2EF|nr:glycosyltransferase family 39 protein [Aestuariispira ectoiniformans]